MTELIEAGTEITAPVEQPIRENPLQVEHLLGVPMHAEAVLGVLHMKMRAISELRVGSVLKTSRPVGEPLDLLVNSAPMAIAEVYPTGDKLSFRVVDLSKID